MYVKKLNLKRTRNMRDLGGIPAADGKKIKSGKLIRSGRMCKLPPETVDALFDLGVDTVIDLRTEQEISERRPTLLRDANYYYLPLVATATDEIIGGKSMARIMYRQSRRIKREFKTPADYMRAMYSILAFNPQSVEKLKRVFDLLLAEENCIIWHCNSGTDRTGIVSMLVETALGVDRQLVIDDYAASFRFLRRRRMWQRTGLTVFPVSSKFKGVLYAFMFTKPQYIIDLIEEMESRYGSVMGYIKECLGVTDEQIATLREKYLE